MWCRHVHRGWGVHAHNTARQIPPVQARRRVHTGWHAIGHVCFGQCTQRCHHIRSTVQSSEDSCSNRHMWSRSLEVVNVHTEYGSVSLSLFYMYASATSSTMPARPRWQPAGRPVLHLAACRCTISGISWSITGRPVWRSWASAALERLRSSIQSLLALPLTSCSWPAQGRQAPGLGFTHLSV